MNNPQDNLKRMMSIKDEIEILVKRYNELAKESGIPEGQLLSNQLYTFDETDDMCWESSRCW